MVREDMIRLYGFSNDIEREWFRLLLTVQGVGAKVSLGVLSVLDPGQLATAISVKDLTAIARAPGVGKRVAERIATELKDKAPAFADADPTVIRIAADVAEARVAGPVAEAVSALTNLGYAQLQAAAAVSAAAKSAGPEATTTQLIRLGFDNPGNRPLANDRVSTGAQACAEEKISDVFPTDVLVIDVVLGLAAARQQALDRQFRVLRPLAGNPPERVIKHQLDGSSRNRLAPARTVENNVLHRLAAQLGGF